MRTTVRDIITNACDETGLKNRSQPIPAGIFETAYLLLKKRLAQYSNTNYLSFTRKEFDFKPTKQMTTIGEFELKEDYEGLVTVVPQQNDLPDSNEQITHSLWFVKETKKGYRIENQGPDAKAYIPVSDGQAKSWFDSFPDFEVENLQEVVRCFFKYDGTTYWDELNFVAFEDFYNFTPNSQIFSYKPVSETLIEIYLPTNYQDFTFKLIYNEFFDFTLDKPLNIPGQFIALFTAGLVYDLATNYPRLSDGTVALLKERLTELEQNVRRSSSVNKFIGRPVRRNSFTYGDFVNGRFLGLM